MSLPIPNEWQRTLDGEVLPNLTDPALWALRPIAFRGKRVLEWGSGHSTLWWARRAERVMVVEHNVSWLADVLDDLEKAGLTNVTARRPVVTGEEATQDRAGRVFARHRYADVAGIWDIIIIDGMLRNTCAVRAAQIIAPRGLVILDNSDREQYGPAHAALHHLRRVDYWQDDNPCWCTTFYWNE